MSGINSLRHGIRIGIGLICGISEIAYNQSWIKSAPLLVVLCVAIVEDSRGGRDIQKYRFPKWGKEIENMDKELYSYIKDLWAHFNNIIT